MTNHMRQRRGETYEPGYRIDNDLAVIDHIGGTRKVDIYLCRSASIGRLVACKVLRPEFCVDFRSLRAVGSEGEMLSRFDHPNVMKCYSYALEPMPRIVMEYVGGQDLKTAFFTGNYKAFGVRDAIAVGRQLADALTHVHSRRVLHLDVKPSNVLYADGRTVLIDFSVAREFDPDNLPNDNAGTRDWMAPEQTKRETVGPYTDVYGLGVVFYQLLTGGELPYQAVDSGEATTDGSVVKAPDYDATVKHPADINPKSSRELGDVALGAISPGIEDRYATPADFRDALDSATG